MAPFGLRDSSKPGPSPEKCRRCAKTTVWVCLVECLFVALFKVVVGLTSGSRAMLGSALYSCTDLISAFLLIINLKLSGRPPDAGHPYGHRKAEHLVSLLISVIVVVGTLALLLVSAMSLYDTNMVPLHWIGIWASVACICVSQIIYRLVICVGQQTDSPATMAHAKHVRLDSISNVAVIVAIAAAELGFHWLDPVIAIVEAIHVLYECSKMIHKDVNFLMDKSIAEEESETIRRLILRDPDVKEVTDIKGTRYGQGISLDIEIQLDGKRKIGDCNATVRLLEATLKNDMASVDSIYVHYHPHPDPAAAGLSP